MSVLNNVSNITSLLTSGPSSDTDYYNFIAVIVTWIKCSSVLRREGMGTFMGL